MLGQVWEVVGGGANNGIVVRRGRSTASPAEGARLATGARIEELALEGDRLRYKLLEGTGPDSGWVSVSVRERGAPPKELLVKSSPPAGVALPVADEPPVVEACAEAAAATVAAGEAIASRGCEPGGWESSWHAGGEADGRTSCGGGGDAEHPEGDGAAAAVTAEASRQHLLPQDLEATDVPTGLLRKGARQLRSVFCRPEDDSIFQGLRVELLRVELDQDQRIKQTEVASNLKYGHRHWVLTKRCPVHTFVLNKLAELMDVDGLAWWTNLYEEASVDCKFHRDRSTYGGDADNPSLKPDYSMIASFGATRDFTLRHDATGREFSFCQENGDVIAFDNEVDEDFLHGLHPSEGRGLPRIAVVMVGKRVKSPKPLLPEFVGVWRPSEERPQGARWTPRLLQFSGKFSKPKQGGGQGHAFQDKEGREVFAPWELAWFVERGSGTSLARGVPGPGVDAFSLRGVVKDVLVWLERSVDQGMFDTLLKNIIRAEGGDRVEHVAFHLVPFHDPASPRIPKLIRLVWKGPSEADIQEKHDNLVGRLVRDLGLKLEQ